MSNDDYDHSSKYLAARYPLSMSLHVSLVHDGDDITLPFYVGVSTLGVAPLVI